MPLKRQKQIEEIFQAAVSLDESERKDYLAKACADDHRLCEEVMHLISSFNHENETAEKELNSIVGRVIGSYRITGEIGRGGMGAVYAAERADGMFRTKAAVKLIKRGMDTDSILRRFRNERQILATLNHPNVARLLDGGTTDEGLPYFVMEYIEGVPLFDYCSKKNLDLKERLKIFREICEAVQAAHEIKVVHRDLKPSNILIKADGAPKLLDFGIAKLLDPELAAATIEPTLTQWRMMTPQSASPEQICGGAITFASDLYSLGVLLYELLAGEKPYYFASHAPHEISRVICEQEPPPPSRVQNAKQKAHGAIESDLDKIILKALRKIPAERYQTADELGADIENYLHDRPVKARFFNPATDAAAPVSAASGKRKLKL
jgi:serine/threonine protein kinase